MKTRTMRFALFVVAAMASYDGEISRLGELYSKNLLTEAEFSMMKAEIINGHMNKSSQSRRSLAEETKASEEVISKRRRLAAGDELAKQKALSTILKKAGETVTQINQDVSKGANPTIAALFRYIIEGPGAFSSLAGQVKATKSTTDGHDEAIAINKAALDNLNGELTRMLVNASPDTGDCAPIEARYIGSRSYGQINSGDKWESASRITSTIDGVTETVSNAGGAINMIKVRGKCDKCVKVWGTPYDYHQAAWSMTGTDWKGQAVGDWKKCIGHSCSSNNDFKSGGHPYLPFVFKPEPNKDGERIWQYFAYGQYSSNRVVWEIGVVDCIGQNNNNDQDPSKTKDIGNWSMYTTEAKTSIYKISDASKDICKYGKAGKKGCTLLELCGGGRTDQPNAWCSSSKYKVFGVGQCATLVDRTKDCGRNFFYGTRKEDNGKVNAYCECVAAEKAAPPLSTALKNAKTYGYYKIAHDKSAKCPDECKTCKSGTSKSTEYKGTGYDLEGKSDDGKKNYCTRQCYKGTCGSGGEWAKGVDCSMNKCFPQKYCSRNFCRKSPQSGQFYFRSESRTEAYECQGLPCDYRDIRNCCNEKKWYAWDNSNHMHVSGLRMWNPYRSWRSGRATSWIKWGQDPISVTFKTNSYSGSYMVGGLVGQNFTNVYNGHMSGNNCWGWYFNPARNYGNGNGGSWQSLGTRSFCSGCRATVTLDPKGGQVYMYRNGAPSHRYYNINESMWGKTGVSIGISLHYSGPGLYITDEEYWAGVKIDY